jgi:hypothetical protein
MWKSRGDFQGRWKDWKTLFLVFQALHGPSFPQLYRPATDGCLVTNSGRALARDESRFVPCVPDNRQTLLFMNVCQSTKLALDFNLCAFANSAAASASLRQIFLFKCLLQALR